MILSPHSVTAGGGTPEAHHPPENLLATSDFSFVAEPLESDSNLVNHPLLALFQATLTKLRVSKRRHDYSSMLAPLLHEKLLQAA